jgi:UDP-N-acetylglucosamine diphosphorylase/glucosamine-1-phosphate N-acetyltransferase
MHYIFHDRGERETLKPLTWTRPVADLRVGILTLSEKWSLRSPGSSFSYRTESYLGGRFDLSQPEGDGVRQVRAAALATASLVDAVRALRPGQQLVDGQGEWLASHGLDAAESVVFPDAVRFIRRPYDVFSANAEALEADFDLRTAGRSSAPISATNTLLGDRIFAEPGARVEASVLNSRSGAIYLAAGSEIMEGSLVRGGLALGEGAQLKLGSKIYGATTIGPGSRVGGEVNNSVLWGNSNKGHDGFLGNAVLGEWCNLGADTNNSNLKNDYSEVKLWSYPSGRFEPTGMQFCGLVMGDHSKAGINTMFNTGTVVGVASNVFGAGFPRNFIPDFSWGGPQGMTEYRLDKALATAERVLARRNLPLDAATTDILSEIFAQTSPLRGGTAIAQ